jgi:NAD-dependent deacetylase
MSAESGISTFRDSGGLWEQYKVEDVATPEGWARDPELVTEFYNLRRQQMLDAQPCLGHKLLAELERFHDVQIITQNVDDLHERAGSTKVIHLHGELMKVTSSEAPNAPSQIITLTPDNADVQYGDEAPDGSPLRPYIVWFGEEVRYIEEARQLVEEADIFVVIGTSLVVYPAAGLVGYARKEIPKFLVDPSDMEGHLPYGFKHIKAKATEGVDILINEIKSI